MHIDYEILIANALGFSLAVVWNEAVISSIKYYTGHIDSMPGLIINAIMTSIVVFVIICIINMYGRSPSAFNVIHTKDTD